MTTATAQANAPAEPRPPRAIKFELPADLEASQPIEASGRRRDEVRLLVTRREDDSFEHTEFTSLPRLLAPGDLVVVNDSATIPAAVVATREDGSPVAVHFSTQLDGAIWVVEPRRVAGRRGERLALPGGGHVRLIARYEDSMRLWVASVHAGDDVHRYLERWGRPIRYPYVPEEWPIELYQTIFARLPGSAEMPSAGRAFSRRVVEGLDARGVAIAAITLHTGVASLEQHESPYAEWFEVTEATARAINATRARGGRVLAVGTTVLRSLESTVEDGLVRPARGWTDLVITPDRPIATADTFLTGLHEPEASHLDMLEAFAGAQHVGAAYAAALDGQYRWHEFGDLHLIL
jgi:S-adenosylmethionine:tRNA ribosyltransferase-isomerase